LQGNQDNTSLKQHYISTAIFKILVYLIEVDECSSDVLHFIQKLESRPHSSVVSALATF